jgi:hypothetical protein
MHQIPEEERMITRKIVFSDDGTRTEQLRKVNDDVASFSTENFAVRE